MLGFGSAFEKLSRIQWNNIIPCPESFKKIAIRYLLQRYVGQFLQEKLSLEQLNLDISNGTGEIKDLSLDIDALNEVADQLNLPIKFVDGCIEGICVSISWNALLSESCFVEISGLILTVHPKQRVQDVSLVESMIDSMSTSMQIAQECLLSQVDSNTTYHYDRPNHSSEKDDSHRPSCNYGNSESDKEATEMNAESSIDGIERVAFAIDTFLNRIKIRFVNTIVRLEYGPKQSNSGVALEVRIDKIDYYDEAGLVKQTQCDTDSIEKQLRDSLSFTSKKFLIEGISFYTDEFFNEHVKCGPAKSPKYEEYKSVHSEFLDKSFVECKQDEDIHNDLDYKESRSCKSRHYKSMQNSMYNSCNPGQIENGSLLDSEPILFAKLYGSQEVKVRLKKNDVELGSKVNFEVKCGSLLVFLSPHQVHLLMELSEGISCPENTETDIHLKSKVLTNTAYNKLLNKYDYKNVENVLSKQITPTNHIAIPSNALNPEGGWSSPPDNISEDEFVPMTTGTAQFKNKPVTCSQTTELSDLDTSFSSSVSHQNAHSAIKTEKKNPGNEQSTCFQVKCNSFSLVVLHEDLLIPSTNKYEIVTHSSVTDMRNKSKDFFTLIGYLCPVEDNQQEFIDLKKKLTNACTLSHLRFIGVPININGSVRYYANKWEMNTNLSIAHAEAIECINDSLEKSFTMIVNKLLVFLENQKMGNSDQFSVPIKPKIEMVINQSQNIVNINSGRSHHVVKPKIEVKVTLENCLIEIDISLIDRISALLNKQNIINKVQQDIISDTLPPSHLDNPFLFEKIMSNKPETKIALKVCTSSLTLKLRFPIPDLRPLSEMERIPWWKRNIRKEIMYVVFQNSEFEVSNNHSRRCSRVFEVRSDDIHIKFKQSEEATSISLLRASVSKDTEKGFNPVRVLLKMYPSKLFNTLEDEPKVKNLTTKSMMGFLEGVEGNVGSIFSKRKVASHQQENDNEVTIPADMEDIHKFMGDTLQNVCYELELDLPEIVFILPSKHIFEVVYNRLVSDLILWMPSAPKISNKFQSAMTDELDLPICSNLILNSKFNHASELQLCKSLRGDAKCLKDEELPSGFASSYGIGSIKNEVIKDISNGQTNFGFTITFGKAVGKIQTPYRDSENKVIPGKNGNLIAIFHKGVIFIAGGYKGNVDSTHSCVFAEQAYLYHKAYNITSTIPITLKRNGSLCTRNLDSVLYPSKNIYSIGANPDAHVDKISVIVCFQMDFDSLKNEKVVKLAGSLSGMTLQYLMTSSSESWMSQLVDMFNVEDYIVEGYTLPDVVTEFDFHFLHCAVAYRPLYLPFKAYVAVNSLSVSSNLTIKGNSSVLSVIIEDAGLFLSQDVYNKECNLKDNYTCVADLGVFEFSMKVDTGSSLPTQELLVSNNIIHVRSCADSFKAFMELLIYLANEGDLVHEAESSDDCKPNPSNRNEAILKPTQLVESLHPKNIQSMTSHDIVETMMQEAMLETSFLEKKFGNSKIENERNRKEFDEFFFPGENLKEKEKSNLLEVTKCTYMSTKTKSVEEKYTDVESALRDALKEEFLDGSFDDCKVETDDEFCVLDEIPGTGIKSPSGKPKVKCLIPEYVVVKECHFDPTQNNSSENILKDPKHFPKPITKYNVQEISIIWHMYGGNDFSILHKINEGVKNNLNDKNGNHKFPSQSANSSVLHKKMKRGPSVTFENGDAKILSEEQSPTILEVPPSLIPNHNINLQWYAVGGSGRSHDTLMELQLSKIRFAYEIYPPEANLESRHIISINDIEIRDRLASSKINKFLYQFSSEAFPRQARANMVQIKAFTKKSDPSTNSPETSASVSVRPIRLNIDQDALIFFGQFFGEILSSEKDSEYGEEECPHTNAMYAPIMTVNYNNMMIMPSEYNTQIKNEARSKMDCEVDKHGKNMPIYIRNFVFSPEVPIRIDYYGKHIDINSQYGTIAGLIIGLGQLNHSEITLKRIGMKTGVLGINKLVSSLISDWVHDIKKNQLPSILGGVGPMHSFVKLFGGLKDLVWLPIEQYQKDGRVLKGLQRGTSAFTSSSAYAALDLSGRFVGCIQSAAETMYDMVSSGPSVRSKSYKTRAGQPQDIREGVTTAFGLVRNGLGDTANTIWKVAAEEHSHKGVSGAVGGVLRQIPPSVVQPIILASEATCTVIGGMTNQLNPDARKEAADKWKV